MKTAAHLLSARVCRGILWVLLLGSPAISSAQETNSEAVCRLRLKRIGTAVRAYKLIHEKPPAKLADLYLEGLVESVGEFACPASGTSIVLASEIDAKSDYTFAPLPGAKDLLVREKTSRHTNGNVLATFSDGSIRLVRGGAAPVSTAEPIAQANVSRPAENSVRPREELKKPETAAAQTEPAQAPRPAENRPAGDSTQALNEAIELTKAGRLADALNVHRRINAGLEDARATMNHAMLELAVGDRPRALRMSETLMQRQPNDGGVLALRGLALFYNSDRAGAERLFAQAHQVNPRLAEDFFQQARGYHQQRTYELAVEHYIAALHMDRRRFYGAHYSLGLVYEAMRLPQMALREYESYLYFDGTSEWAAQARAAVQRLRAAHKGVR